MASELLSSSQRLPAQPKVAVVGAGGLVGSSLVEVLQQRNFPFRELQSCAVHGFQSTQVANADLVFLAAPELLALRVVDDLLQQGNLVVDLSAAWRMHPKSVLLQCDVNEHLLQQHQGLLSCPNCTNLGLIQVLHVLQQHGSLRGAVVSTYQSASGGGRRLLKELHGGEVCSTHPLTANVIPQCDSITGTGATAEEVRVVEETLKILTLHNFSLAVTCVRVPVEIGHGLSLTLEATTPWNLEKVSAWLASANGIHLEKPGAYPTPRSVRGRCGVFVGRLRLGPKPQILQLWLAFDNLLTGAAHHAVKLAELLLDTEKAR